MDQIIATFTSSFLANVTSNLTQLIFNGVASKMRRKIGGDECRLAFDKCVKFALTAAMGSVSKGLAKDDVKNIQKIYKEFFEVPEWSG